jgi:2-oxoglutarate dehydrogenase complex dehydrogenase (E1) component-like enzyme
MGAWMHVQDRIMTAGRHYNDEEVRPAYIGREVAASPASGYGMVHNKEQAKITEMAMSSKVMAYGHGATEPWVRQDQ